MNNRITNPEGLLVSIPTSSALPLGALWTAIALHRSFETRDALIAEVRSVLREAHAQQHELFAQQERLLRSIEQVQCSGAEPLRRSLLDPTEEMSRAFVIWRFRETAK